MNGASTGLLSPEDELLYAFRRNVVVAASAGTGKTHRLTGLYVMLTLGLTSRGQREGRAAPALSPERIVATTFSRDAAREMAHRIEGALRALATAAPDETLVFADVIAARQAALGIELTRAELRQRAQEALARWPSARIDTLHGLAAEVALGHALAVGLPPDAKVLDEDEAAALSELALDETLGAALGDGGRRADAARDLVAACGGVAAARRDVTRLFDRLDEEGLAPAQLALADHAAEARRRGRQLVAAARACAHDGGQALREAARGFTEQIRSWVESLEEGSTLRPLPVAAAEAAGALITTRMPPRTKRSQGEELLADLVDTLRGSTKAERAARLVALLAEGPSLPARERALVALLDDARARLSAARRRAGGISFGEILRAARRALAEHPEVATSVRSGIEALLVDEFQDTSRVQRDIVYLLRERPDAAIARTGGAPTAAGLSAHGLFLVGDRKQSIYGFRGADVSVFCRTCAELAGRAAAEALALPETTWRPIAHDPPLADFVALRESRRSGERVVAFVNAFAERDFAADGSAPRDYEVRYGPGERLSSAGARASGARDEVVVIRDDASCPAEAEPLLREATGPLREALVAAAFVHREARRGVLSWRDVAILTRRRSTIPLVELALTRLDVPYVVAGRALFDAQEVRDVAAALRLVLDPRDRLALATVLRGPMAALSDGALVTLSLPGRGLTVPLTASWLRDGAADTEGRARAVDDTRRARDQLRADVRMAMARLARDDRARLDAFRGRFVDVRRAALRLAPADAVRAVIETFDLDRVLAALPRSAARIGNLDRLVAIARRRGGTLAGFVRWLDRRMADDADEAEAAVFSAEDDAVRLTTIHASKGLDFPVVLLLDLNAAPRPSSAGLSMIAPSPERPATLAVRHLAREGRAVLASIGSPDAAAPMEALGAEPTQIATEALRAAREEARGREHAERRRLAYVAMTRARGALVLISPAQTPRSGSTFATLAAGLSDPELCASITRAEEARALLEEAEAARAAPAHAPGPRVDPAAVPAPPVLPAVSPSRTLTIATTPLMVFGTCARRFQLRNLLALDEPVSSGQLDLFGADAFPGELDDERPAGDEADPRALGRAAHRVLEQWPETAWGRPVDVAAVVTRLADEGLPPRAAETVRIAEAVARFLCGAYARSARDRGALLLREEPFSLPIPLPNVPQGAERALALRGAMDLCVEYPDGSVDVIDYKRSRPRADLSAYAFQLRAYALAARRLRGADTRVRAGVVFLGSATEPVLLAGAGAGGSLSEAEHDAFAAELATLGERLAEARWNDRWAGVAVETCKRLRCGFVTACHGRSKIPD